MKAGNKRTTMKQWHNAIPDLAKHPRSQIHVADHTFVAPSHVQQRLLLVHVDSEQVRVRARVEDAVERERARVLRRIDVPYHTRRGAPHSLLGVDSVQMLAAAVDAVERDGGVHLLWEDMRGEGLVVVAIHPDSAVHLGGLGGVEVYAGARREEAVEWDSRDGGRRSFELDDGLGYDSEDLGAGDFVEEVDDGLDAGSARHLPGRVFVEGRLPCIEGAGRLCDTAL